MSEAPGNGVYGPAAGEGYVTEVMTTATGYPMAAVRTCLIRLRR